MDELPRFYVLRLWHEPQAGPQDKHWRASLIDARGGGRHSFGTLAELGAYLSSFDPAWPDDEEKVREQPLYGAGGEG